MRPPGRPAWQARSRLLPANGQVAFPVDPAIEAEVDLCVADGAYFLRARLNVSLPGVEQELAEMLLNEAEKICPYSNATRGNIEVTMELVRTAL